MVENQTRYLQNTTTIRVVLGIIFLTILGIDGYFIFKSHQISASETALRLTVQEQSNELDLLCVEIVNSTQDTAYPKVDFKVIMHRFNLGTEAFLELNSKLFYSNPVQLAEIEKGLNKSQTDLFSLVEIVSKKRAEAYENKRLLNSRSQKLATDYHGYISEIQSASIQNSSKFHDRTFYVHIISLGLLLLIAALGHFLLFRPVETANKKLTQKVWSEQSESHGFETKVKEVQLETTKAKSLLKVKTAQVLKLQESLELAIAYSNKTQQDKGLIYFNLANDLSEYIKVMVLQQKIIENQTSMEGNENWVTLTNTVSQLNSMSGNYFNLAKNGQNLKTHGEVYLTQLLSEILVSMKLYNGVSFEQISDLPTINTDIELLKRVLKPYFKLMMLNTSNTVIKYSGRLDSSFCEIKFFGLQPAFEKELTELEQKDIADFSFEEFKVHMANKTIVERGGKYWMQQDLPDKGVFTIYWSL